MKKLTLDLEQLRVQSFAAEAEPAGGGGSVHALEATVTCIYPRCGTAVERESCYNGCTYDDC